MTTMTLPPGPAGPRFWQGLNALLLPNRGFARMRDRYGSAFTTYLPVLGRCVVISDPAEIKQLFMTSQDLADISEFTLGRVLGPGSFFSVSGEEHRKQRKLLVPPFHGRRLAAYERIVEEETRAEAASWPQGEQFPIMPATMRITLNVILRAVFGAEGAEFARLRELLPKLVTLGSRLTLLPISRTGFGRLNPWRKFDALRAAYDEIVYSMIAATENDERLSERDDVLALMVQARYDDGSRMSRSQIADQLITLLSAGHETTATTLAWAIERLRRHPDLLRELTDEVDAGGSALREATITEVQRTRPVIVATSRQVRTDHLDLGRWRIPKGYSVIVSIGLIHDDESVFPNARAFDPTRFLGAKPDLYQWIPFGGGHRRCMGAAFASMEMNAVLRTLLQDFSLVPTDAPGERWHSRGVANAPAGGGQTVVLRRAARPRESISAGVKEFG